MLLAGSTVIIRIVDCQRNTLILLLKTSISFLDKVMEVLHVQIKASTMIYSVEEIKFNKIHKPKIFEKLKRNINLNSKH
jgi:hypothetical protein